MNIKHSSEIRELISYLLDIYGEFNCPKCDDVIGHGDLYLDDKSIKCPYCLYELELQELISHNEDKTSGW